jgi:methionyl-tRNA formyltransferase
MNTRYMKITILVDNPRSWFVPFARELQQLLASHGDVVFLNDARELVSPNDIAFLLSYEKIVESEILRRSRSNIVVHASELPKGKGMSPMTWQVLEGCNTIPLTLFEAVEALDSGPVYLRDTVHFRGNELLPEMQELLGVKIVQMCSAFVERWPAILNRGVPQTGESTFYRKRSPEDSKLDPHKSLAEQFNLLRVVDNEQYPAFIELMGRRYTFRIESAKE